MQIIIEALILGAILVPWSYIIARVVSKAWHKSKYEEVEYHG